MRVLFGSTFFLIFVLCCVVLLGMWFGEDQGANNMKTHVEGRLDYVFVYWLTIMCVIMNVIGRLFLWYVCIPLRSQQMCTFIDHN